MNRVLFGRLALGIGLCLLVTCGDGGGSGESLDVSTLYSASVTNVQIEVAYMTGAEPYVSETAGGNSVWEFLQNNVSALFAARKAVAVPTTLEEMQEIPAGETNYSGDDVLSLADTYRTLKPIDGNTASIFVLFVDGYYVEDGAVSTSTLGVTFGDTGVIAIFKPAITSNTFPNGKIRTFTEQTVLIHEVGHAVGLVNRGVALTSEHHDAEHGAHCTNTNCVMYYLNEGAKDLLEFILRGDPSVESVIFGQECLDDTDAATP